MRIELVIIIFIHFFVKCYHKWLRTLKLKGEIRTGIFIKLVNENLMP